MSAKKGSCRDSNAGPLASCAWVYPKRAITLLDDNSGPRNKGDTYNHTTRPQDLVILLLIEIRLDDT
jgi:hypothetical protein